MPHHPRPATHNDAAGIIRAHRQSIREVCGPDYTVKQIDVWSGRDFSESFWCDTMDADTVEVIVDPDEQVRGFCHHGLPAHATNQSCYEVMSLYLCSEVLSQGWGRHLLENAITQAQHLNCREIRLNSTTTAKAFYRHMGFRVVAESAKEMQGVPIPCFVMSLPLAETLR